MTNEFRKKAVELGKLMNSKSKLSVPLVKCIIECFEIVFDEQDIDYMLLMKDGYYSRDELKELWQLDGEAFGESIYKHKGQRRNMGEQAGRCLLI